MDKQMTILIVDDASINRKILRGILESDYRIFEAENGARALDCLQQEHIDVIILDLMMPVMNGLEFLEIVRGNSRYSDIPIIVNSQAGEQENEYKALELGADDFIAKPYNPKIAKRRIANLVDKYIYQRKVMQREINRTQEQLSTLIDTVPGGIAVLHINEKISLNYFNAGLCRLLGYSKEEIETQIADDLLKVVVAEDRERISDMVMVSRNQSEPGEKKKPRQCEVRMVRKNGDLIWLRITAKPLESEPKDVHAVFMDITDEKEVENQLQESLEQLRYRAEHDKLTGILSREAYYRAASSIINENEEITYVIGMWNVDRFKVVNELFGSRTGDRILCGIAQSMQRITAGVGVCGRMEADCFSICLPEDYLNEHLKELEDLLTGNANWEPNGYPVMSHIGFYRVENKELTVNLMCDRANMALMQVKSNYLKRWNYYNESLKETIINEQELVNDMETALKERQFVVFYQPMIDARKKAVIRAEALVRWKHPKKGMVSPGTFIPLFEKNGFISKLDMYVCEEVCRFQAELKKHGIPIIPISINLSRMNFYNQKLCREILGLVQKYGIDPENLEIEITESAYKENSQDLIHAIKMFQKNGFKVLMDDFGSGYSSLNMLKDLSMDILKIDMKFIDNLEDSERATNIMFSIIRMAQSLNMDTVAEGVETQNQFEMLSCMGCDCIQGYYFSRPLPEEEFARGLMDDQKRAGVEGWNEKHQTVLIVDDVEENREILAEIIGDKYQILFASSGEEAMAILRKEFVSISLVITDIYMPDGDGIQLLENMQNSTLTKDIPVLMVTAYDDVENIEKSLDLGALDVISKPYDPDILQRRIENILKISEKQNIELEVRALREASIMKKQVQSMLTNNAAGMCRLRMYWSENLEISDVIFTNKRFERWHPEVSSNTSGDLTLDTVFVHIANDEKNAFREQLISALHRREEFWQYTYRVIGRSGIPEQHILSCNMEYGEDDILLDLVEMELVTA